MSYYSPEMALKIAREETDRAAKQSYWLSQFIDHAPSADAASEASAVEYKRSLVARLIERIAGKDREDTTNA